MLNDKKQDFLQRKINNEKIVFIAMSKIYCDAKHSHKNRINLANSTLFESKISQKLAKWARIFPSWREASLCDECLNLALKAQIHTQHCVRMQEKSFCHLCPKSCYSKQDLKQISAMMKYSGKKIILYHPILALKYIYYIIKSRSL